MTIAEFHNNFDIEVDKTLDYQYAYIQPEQKDYWLNKAQQRFVKYRAFGNNIFRTSFEETQKRIDDLEGIVKEGVPLTPSLTSANKYRVPLPEDYLYLMRHQVNTGTTYVGGLQVSNDEINILLKDPFWSPTVEQPLYYIISNNVVYETKGAYTPTQVILTYVKKYSQFRYGTAYTNVTTDTSTELSQDVHQEILDIAISMFLENIESGRYQSNLNELSKTE